ncbi:MAG: sulfotransferase domain-containing protein [Alteromonadaceae bacterium]|nr:sulfotransferase domain-containing protein [Alteromonadaceae bacterium]
MKHVVLHIGQYKTGSSSIQNFLTSHPDYLAKNKVKFCERCLLKNEPDVGIRHFKLTINTATENCFWPDLVDEIKNGDEETYIVSYENMLFGLDEKQIAYITQILREFDVSIIWYLRRQDKFLNSWYAEIIKSHKGTMTKSTFLKRYHTLGFYGKALQKWHKHFDSARFSVISFEQLKREKQNVVDSFLQLTNIPKTHSIANHADNPSLGSKGVVNILAFNKSVHLRPEIHRNVAQFFINYFDDDSKFSLLTDFNLPVDFFSHHFDDKTPTAENAQLSKFIVQTCKDCHAMIFFE